MHPQYCPPESPRHPYQKTHHPALPVKTRPVQLYRATSTRLCNNNCIEDNSHRYCNWVPESFYREAHRECSRTPGRRLRGRCGTSRVCDRTCCKGPRGCWVRRVRRGRRRWDRIHGCIRIYRRRLRRCCFFGDVVVMFVGMVAILVELWHHRIQDFPPVHYPQQVHPSISHPFLHPRHHHHHCHERSPHRRCLLHHQSYQRSIECHRSVLCTPPLCSLHQQLQEHQHWHHYCDCDFSDFHSLGSDYDFFGYLLVLS
mmetsp:Transcript_6633/g.14709  ORF Transcript_6633/g.14709 Transcript_6633/m.14709 type:complete len:256 (-) Transcript_6633:610-1377(-)